MRRFLVFLVAAALLASALLFLGEPAAAEPLYVCIREGTYLNGREKPSTKAHITMRLFNGDMVEPVSFTGEWVEIEGGESGTSFVKSVYLSEILSPIRYTNVSGGRVRVRKSPASTKAISWIGAGKTITVTRQILGWGYAHGGWIDLSYFQPEHSR